MGDTADLTVPESNDGDQLRRRVEELQILRQIDAVLQTAGNEDELLERSLEAIAGFGELEVQKKLGVFFVDREKNGLRLAKTYGHFTDEFLEKEAWIPMGSCLCGRVAISGEMLVSGNCFNDPRHEHTFEGMTAHGHYIVPIKAPGNLLGVMFLYTDPDPQWDQRRIGLLETIGNQIGVAIERMRGEAEIRRRAEELHVLHEIDQVIHRAQSRDQLLEETLAAIAGLSELEVQSKSGVFLIDEQQSGLRLVKVYGDFTEEFLEKEAWIPLGACLCGRAAVSGEMIISGNCFHDPRHEHTFEGMTAHGHYIIPLRYADTVLGVIFLYTDPDPQWDERRVRLLQAIGGQIGVALERLNAEHEIRRINTELEQANSKMRQELEAAADVQQALLPQEAPAVSQAIFAWQFRPSTQLAGDTFNVFQLDEHHVGLYSLDVSGHGVAAALLAVTLSRLLSPEHGKGSLLFAGDSAESAPILAQPVIVAEELNRRFQIDMRSSQFFTMIYGVLDLDSGRFRYVCAGHPALVLAPHGDPVRLLKFNSFPIGITEEADYEERELTLEPGDRLYLYSDGVIEAMNGRDEEFGDERLVQTIEELRTASLEESTRGLVQQVVQWCGAAGPDDDVSVLAVERVAESS